MNTSQSIRECFQQLSSLLQTITTDQYKHKHALLNASIGQHMRHVIELFVELDKGYENGTVNYDKRKRDHNIETDPQLANEIMWKLWTVMHKPDKPLLLQTGTGTVEETILSGYHRELLYNLEHTIHHMALIRIGLNGLTNVTMPENFGVAPSTQQYRATCAQ